MEARISVSVRACMCVYMCVCMCVMLHCVHVSVYVCVYVCEVISLPLTLVFPHGDVLPSSWRRET